MAHHRRMQKVARTRRRVLELRSTQLPISKIAKKVRRSERQVYRYLAEAAREWDALRGTM